MIHNIIAVYVYSEMGGSFGQGVGAHKLLLVFHAVQLRCRRITSGILDDGVRS